MISDWLNDYMGIFVIAGLIAIISPYYFVEVFDYCGDSMFNGCQPIQNDRISFMALLLVILLIMLFPMFDITTNTRTLRRIENTVNSLNSDKSVQD